MIPTENMIPIYAERGKPLCIGRRGEENARYVVFDVSHWQKIYGPGTAQLLVQRTGETTPYPAALIEDGSRVIWVITLADTEIPGSMGKAELCYFVNDTLAKSEIWTTIVLDALGDPSETPPDAHKAWADKVLEAGSDAQNAAAKAKDAAEAAGEARNGAEDAREAAGQSAAEADASAKAAQLAKEGAEDAIARQPYPNAETGTWWIWIVESGSYVDTGIRTSEQGDPGKTPQRGVDYWTAEDVLAIQNYIDRQLGVIENGAY